MSLVVAVDIGGTQIRAAVYEPNNPSPLNLKRVRSLALQPGVFDRLVSAIESVWPSEQQVAAIGFSSPGPLDPYRGIVLATPNIPEWKNFPVREKLSERFGVPVHIDNDANLAGLAEWKYGAAKGHHNVLYLTISTGIGGGVIIEDRLLQGYHGLAAEVGHMIIDPNGPPCGCGHRGHVESFASGPSIARYVNEQLAAGTKSTLQADPNLSGRQVADAALQGDSLARAAFARAGEYLGIGVANYLAILDPSIIVFGGGVSQVGDLLFKPFEESLKKHILHPRYLEGLVIARAALGDDAGLLGARALAELKTEGVKVAS
jgi:glucokinase